ncbi:hypothetical protein LUZ62_042579 [Rhynchospora pubera]|uniref:DUF7734 domain-containing protein n=1 Tax=Rhynchospora pubera TaxID=906938 RepID=A0AAV8FKP1_9POAL|nr:hypothetical protein LUZ62_042579 [Rhynchospora pubera]
MALHIPRPTLYQKLHLSLHTRSNSATYLFPTDTLSQFQNQVSVNMSKIGAVGITCRARRRVRYVEEDEEGDEEYGNNLEIAMLEAYSEKERKEALLVKATVDGEEELVLIFKGFSSCLTATTVTDRAARKSGNTVNRCDQRPV